MNIKSDPRNREIHTKENLVALSALFHQSDDFPDFYVRFGDACGGFPGIWQWIGDVVVPAFTAAELAAPAESYEWIDSMDEFIRDIYAAEFLWSTPRPDLETLAKAAIAKNSKATRKK